MENVLLREYLTIHGREHTDRDWLDRPCVVDQIDQRWVLTQEYAFAVPNDSALDAIARYGPIVEVGAGTGYWAALLASRGVDVIAFDRLAAGTVSGWRQQQIGRWHPVQRLQRFRDLAAHRNRALFLCWPPYAEPMASRAVRAHGGRTVIYVGEYGGCTGDDQFHELLAAQFDEVKTVAIPQWWGLHDRLWIFQRKGKGKG